MPQLKKPGVTAAIGCSPHSGWAALVAFCGDVRAPRVLLRERLELADSRVPGAKQPYHDIERLPLEKAAARLASYRKAARDLASDGLRSALRSIEAAGHRANGVAILQSHGRQGTDLQAILSSHALIHTADGEHFREALAEASQGCGLEAVRVHQRELAETAAAALGRPAAELQAYVLSLGRLVGPPWGADQKAAALLAWLLLAER